MAVIRPAVRRLPGVKHTIKSRTKHGQFEKGSSGNPSGRPRGSRNKTTLAAEQLLAGEAERLTRQAIDLALKGNLQAVRLCMERLFPVRKERLFELELPPARSTQEFAEAVDRVLMALGESRITLGEAHSLIDLLDRQASSRSRCKAERDFEERRRRMELLEEDDFEELEKD